MSGATITNEILDHFRVHDQGKISERNRGETGEMICGKITYHDRKTAVDALKAIKADKRPSRSKKKPVRPYFCAGCNGWHTTSNKSKHHAPRSITKLLHTIEIKQPRQLFITDLTSQKLNASV